MKLLRIFSSLALLIALGFVGYHYLTDTQITQDKQTVIDRTPLVIHHSNYNQEDQKFLEVVRKSILETRKVIDKLEVEILDAENNDEPTEAQDSMDDARKQLLYQWNNIHNGYIPKDPSLQQLKTSYESILDQYRQGLMIEMDALENATTSQMKDGYQITTQARSDLQQLSKEISK
ncbi:MAG TPA: hypothetical protein VJ824_15705 [Bacillota bacterium]|nr:hypothetical protein [Bacillota bacterium]